MDEKQQQHQRRRRPKKQTEDGQPSSGGASSQQQKQKQKQQQQLQQQPEPSTSSSASNSCLSFEDGINPPLCDGILSYVGRDGIQGFERMTPVQAATIPMFLHGRKDVAVQAVTGSGKTLAFLIPIIQRLWMRSSSTGGGGVGQQGEKHRGQGSDLIPLKHAQVSGLILSPTRELAQQTHRVATALCECCHLKGPMLLVGGGGGIAIPGSSNSPSGRGGGGRRRSTILDDVHDFRRVGHDVLIGTPGRVGDILSKYEVIDCTELEFLVLDEADVLLNMGFSQTLQVILRYLPKHRRTGLFSATTSNASSHMAANNRLGMKEWMLRAGMRNPVWIDVAVTRADPQETATEKAPAKEATKPTAAEKPGSRSPSDTKAQRPSLQQATPSSLTNYYLVSPLVEKLSRLATFLIDHRHEKNIVFFLTCACVDFYATVLGRVLSSSKSNDSIRIEALHGKMVQKKREKVMERFRSASSIAGSDNESVSNAASDNNDGGSSATTSLFCTDVAARGLDVSDVRWVVQFDAPQDPSFYVHRVGRSARAGKDGRSLLFLTRREESYVDLLRNRKVPLSPLPKSERCRPLQGMDDDEEDNDIVTEEGDSTVGPIPGETEEYLRNVSTDENNDDAVLNPKSPSPEETVCTNGPQGKTKNIRTSSDPNLTLVDVLPKVRDLCLRDRDCLEKGTRAFTSYIRAYKEHHCSFIFRFASLDLGLLATSFCLLRLPKMPELRDALRKNGGRLPRFKPAGYDVDIFAIPYLDKAREKARQKRLKEELESGGKNAKLIEAEQRKAERERKVKERRQIAIDKGRNPNKKRGNNARLMDEWEDLAKEERLVKRLKKRKITKEEFEEQLNG